MPLIATLYVFLVILLAACVYVIRSAPLRHESLSAGSAHIYVVRYLRTGTVSFVFFVLILSIEFTVTVAGTREQLVTTFGLPGDNPLPYVIYAFLHHNLWHAVENAGTMLVCGGLVEERIGSKWYLFAVVALVPIGSYLTTCTAQFYSDAPWDGAGPTVGFSIVTYAVVVLFTRFVLPLAWRELWSKQTPHRSWRLFATGMILLFLLCSFLGAIDEGKDVSNLGHITGMFLGLVVVVIYEIVHLVRRRGLATK